MLTPAQQRELAAEAGLLYARYNEALDDAAIEQWPGFFTADGHYRLTTRDNLERGLPLCFVLCEGQGMLRDRAEALRSAVFYRRRVQRRILSGLRLTRCEGFDAGGAEVRASFVVYESMGDEPSRLLACGRSTDVIARVDGELRFRSRLCVLDARVMPDSLVFPI